MWNLKKIRLPAIYCQEHCSDVRVYMALRQQTVHIRPQCGRYCHVSICPTMAPRLVSWYRRNVSSLCSRELTAGVMSASVANCLPSKCFLWCLKRCKSLGLILPAGLATGYGTTTRRIWTTLSTVCSQFFPSFKASWKVPGRQAICNGCQQQVLKQNSAYWGYPWTSAITRKGQWRSVSTV